MVKRKSIYYWACSFTNKSKTKCFHDYPTVMITGKFSQCLISVTHGKCLVNIQEGNERRISWQIPSYEGIWQKATSTVLAPCLPKTQVTGRVQSLARSGAACSCTMWWILSQVFRVTCACGAVLLSTKYGVCALWGGQGHVSPVSKSRSWSLPHLFPTYHLLCSLSVSLLWSTQHSHIYIFFLYSSHAPTHFLSLSSMRVLCWLFTEPSHFILTVSSWEMLVTIPIPLIWTLTLKEQRCFSEDHLASVCLSLDLNPPCLLQLL